MIAKIKRLLTEDEGLAMVIVVGFMALSIPLLTAALSLAGTLSADSRVKLEIARGQYSNIGATEYVRYLSDSPETWNHWIQFTEGLEILSIGGHTVEIEAISNGVSNYGFLDYCIFGENEVEIGEDSNIQCSIGSNGDVDVEEGSTVTGDIVSGGNVTLGQDVAVYGDVTAAGMITLDDGAMVMGDIDDWASLGSITGPIPNYNVTITITDEDGNETTEILAVDGAPLPLTFTLAAGGANMSIDPGDTDTVLPGSYGTLQVGQNATLNLRSGSYAFDDVNIDEGVTIYLDLTGGPIIFDVVNDLEYQENVTMVAYGATAADFAVRVQGEAEFDEQGQYLGTYFTLRSSGDELEAGENTTLTGGLYGMQVEVDEETTIIGMPSVAAYLAFFGL